MGALLKFPPTFEQRIAEFNQQVQAETEGEYSVVPTHDGYVSLQYKGFDLIQILAKGKKYKDLYHDIDVLVKAFLGHHLADLAHEASTLSGLINK